MDTSEENKEIEVNGKKISEEELKRLRENSDVRLTEISPNVFKKLERLRG